MHIPILFILLIDCMLGRRSSASDPQILHGSYGILHYYASTHFVIKLVYMDIIMNIHMHTCTPTDMGLHVLCNPTLHLALNE